MALTNGGVVFLFSPSSGFLYAAKNMWLSQTSLIRHGL